jgi:hypothetical protein
MPLTKNSNRLFFLLPAAAVFGSGCSLAPYQRVAVNLRSIPLPAEVNQEFKHPYYPAPILGAKSADEIINPVAAKKIEIDRPGERAKLAKFLEAENNKAIGEITANLKQFYRREYDAFFLAENAKVAPQNAAMIAKSKLIIKEAFDSFATARAPVLLRLSFLIGFPPSAELRQIRGENLGPNEIKRNEEIRELQRKLAELDREYENVLVRLDDQLREQLGDEVTEFSKRLEAKQAEISARADREARSQVSAVSKTIHDQILNKFSLSFDRSEAARASVQVPASTNKIQVPYGWKTSSPAEFRQRLQSELEIWLRLNRYERAQEGENAPDKTAEFESWRKTLDTK